MVKAILIRPFYLRIRQPWRIYRFEKGNHQPEGVYRVDIWRNDEFVATQDIRFTTSAGKAGEKSGGLMPCFGLDWVKRLGVNIAAFPALNKDANDTCINLPEAIPAARLRLIFYPATKRQPAAGVDVKQRVAIFHRKSGMKASRLRWLTTVSPAVAGVIRTAIS
jgi:hypothetical protein